MQEQNIQDVLQESLLSSKAEDPSLIRKRSGLSQVFLTWIWPTLKQADQQVLELNDIRELEIDDKSVSLHHRFKEILSGMKYSKQVLAKALILTFKKDLFIALFYLALIVCSSLVVPIMIREILNYIIDKQDEPNTAIIIIAAIIVSRFVNIIASAQSRYFIRTIGYDAQTALSVEILCKCIRTSFMSNTAHTSGEVINLMQVDTSKLQFVTFYIGIALLVPVQIAITIYLMFNFIGISFLSGLATLIIAGLLNALIGKYAQRLQAQLMKDKDARTKCANQIFSQIKFIKINAFEEYFKQKLSNLRNIEYKTLQKRFLMSVFVIFSVWLAPILILNATFATLVLQGELLTAADTFAIISLFQMLQDPLLQLPMAINELLSTNIALQRIQKFLYTSEIMKDCIKQEYSEDAISIKNGNFYWNRSNEAEKDTQVVPENPLILKDINLTIPKGQFVAIIGDVGSGKSSLLQAILGEMLYEDEPQITISGSISYVSQKYWIQNATVKDNILFGQEFNERRYKEAIQYSCLQQDIKILIQGDQTMIGEKGINLSGGQKARISLARAIYNNSDILILDDPISAVDAYVGNFIMTECLNTYLKDKTRILVTHALNNCKYTDYIYLMENGRILEQGTFQEIKESENFKKIYQKFYSQKEEEQDQEDLETQIEHVPALAKQISSKQEEEHKITEKEDDLIIEEDRNRGNISLDTYKAYYHNNGGLWYFSLLAFIQISWMISYLGTNYWIAHWSTESENNPDIDGIYYLEIYFYFGLGQGVFALFRPLLIIFKSLAAANSIHRKMINCLIYAPQCQFFERVPLGRILNRLTKDQNSLDTEIFWGVSWFYLSVSILIANTILYVYSSTYYIIIPIFVYFLLCWRVQRFYMAAGRELQRLDSITKSPILSFFQESVQGLTFIRVFQKEEEFIKRHGDNLDKNRKVFIDNIGTNAWFIMILGLMSLFINLGAIVYCVFLSTANPALTGLLLVYASQIDTNVAGVVQSFGLVENGMVSFERCLAFTKVEPEKAYKKLVDKSQKKQLHEEEVVEDWPNEGTVQYKNYSVKYREGLKPALSDFNVVICPKEKVGVVGRTGAGKSTVTLTLLRILEAFEGTIQIDGVDISGLSLKQLREGITMIMQDATIFDGTLRDNIDPLRKKSDDEILYVMEQCCLSDLLQKRTLDADISEGGDNLSAGEKQLICIARAVLKGSKIVLIDEATANIDVETEHKIQETIQRAFKDCTVITIAHRINTILHCDKILVIDQGHIKEFGNTQTLLEQKDSLFYGIYQEALRDSKK